MLSELPAPVNGGGTFVHQGFSPVRQGIGVPVHADFGIVVDRYVDGTKAYVDVAMSPSGGFMQFACTYDGTTIRAYVNGSQSGPAPDDTRPMPTIVAAANVARLAPRSDNFIGSMGEIALYDHALTTLRI